MWVLSLSAGAAIRLPMLWLLLVIHSHLRSNMYKHEFLCLLLTRASRFQPAMEYCKNAGHKEQGRYRRK